MKILAVDDNRDNVELLCQILEDDYDVITAYNGPDCIKLAKEQQPDLIILDIFMPEMDGYEVLQRLKEDESTKDICVIFLTARYKDTDRIVRGLELGAFDYITKPIEDEILYTKIRSASQIIMAEKEIKKQRDELEKLSEELMESLSENKLLLREIHHRVKNNMQVISSLLKLQASSIGDERVTDALMECQGRVQTMAFVHEMLYGLDSLAVIDFESYISRLAGNIFQSHSTVGDRVKMKVDAEEIKLEIERATPLGLIVNELLNNSLKYGFPENRSGEIAISLRTVGKDMIEFVYSDNGIGIPEDLDWRNTDSLGLQLVNMLAEDQLDGTVNLDRGKETRFTIRFRHEENE